MNNLEKEMLEILKRLKEDYNVLAIKSEFEAEGSRVDELVKLNEIVFRADMDIYIKIGGCEAVSDLEKCKTLGAKGIMAPMIETPFAMKKFLDAINRVYSEKEQEDMFYIFNAETITGYNNLDEILQLEGINRIHSIAVGRVDFTASLGYGRDYINSEEIMQYTRVMLEKAREHKIMAGVGGGISPEAIPILKKLSDVLEKFETRKVVFGYDDKLDIRKGLEYAIEFEILYLKNKAGLYQKMAAEDSARVKMMEQRLEVIRSGK
jgi:hypothetical protein